MWQGIKQLSAASCSFPHWYIFSFILFLLLFVGLSVCLLTFLASHAATVAAAP